MDTEELVRTVTNTSLNTYFTTFTPRSSNHLAQGPGNRKQKRPEKNPGFASQPRPNLLLLDGRLTLVSNSVTQFLSKNWSNGNRWNHNCSDVTQLMSHNGSLTVQNVSLQIQASSTKSSMIGSSSSMPGCSINDIIEAEKPKPVEKIRNCLKCYRPCKLQFCDTCYEVSIRPISSLNTNLIEKIKILIKIKYTCN